MTSGNNQFPRINVKFIGLSLLVFVGMFVLPSMANEKNPSKMCLPILDIKIDGQAQDWSAIKPHLQDLPGDSMVFTHTGIDILSCTLAVNPRKDTLFVMIKVMGRPNFEHNLVQYLMGFDDPTVKSGLRVSYKGLATECFDTEWLIGVDSSNKFWIWDSSNKNSDQGNLKTWESSENKISRYAQDDVIEYSIPFSIFQGMKEFKLELFLKLRDRDKTLTDQVQSETVFILDACKE